MPTHELKRGDYVLGTKYRDAHAQDHFAIGYYGGTCCNGERHRVLDSNGNDFRHNGFRRCERISVDAGNWLVQKSKDLEKWYIARSLFQVAKYRKIRQQLKNI